MPSYGKTIAGNQPDDTQGIAKVGLIDGSTLIAELVGCVIHLSKKDKSLRNILKVETNCKMEYFIFVPWFHSCRPTEMNENGTKIKVKLHQYRNKRKEIEFLVDEDNSKTIFKNYHSDNYFVIPCPEFKKFQKSSFLKKWSSNLLLHNNSSQIYKGEKSFYGFRKDGGLFKFFGLNEDINKLEEQGVLLIHPSIYESYVIGCYKKENGRIKKYCFLLKGLEDIDEPAERRRSLCGRSEEGRGNPPLDQLPSGRNEGTHGAGDSHPPPLPTVRTDGSAGTLPPQLRPRSEEGRANPPLDQLPSGRNEGTHGAGDSHTPPLPTVRTDGSGGTLPPQLRPRSEEGRANPPLDQLLSGRSEGTHGAVDSHTPPLPTVRTDGSGGTLPPQLRPRSEEGRANPPLDQLPSGRSEGTHGAGNSHPPHLPSARTDGSGGTLPPQLRPRSEEGRGNPPPDQLLSGRSEGGRGNPTAEQRPLSRSEATGGVGGSITPQLRPDKAFLGRHLGIKDYTIKAIDDDYKYTEEKAVQMFSKWQQKCGKEATPAKLKEVLEKKLENRQLAEEVEEWMRTGEST